MATGVVPLVRRPLPGERPHFGVILEPDDLAGVYFVAVTDVPACGFRFSERTSCGRVAGHSGSCWECSDELAADEGPFALGRPGIEPEGPFMVP